VGEASYVVRQIAENFYTVDKYDYDRKRGTYTVRNGSCDCPGFRIKREKKRGPCKHITMVMKFDPDTMKRFSSDLTGVRDEVAQSIYRKVAKGLEPFVDTITLRGTERNPATDGIVKINIHATPHKTGDRVVTKLTGYVRSVAVEVVIE